LRQTEDIVALEIAKRRQTGNSKDKKHTLSLTVSNRCRKTVQAAKIRKQSFMNENQSISYGINLVISQSGIIMLMILMKITVSRHKCNIALNSGLVSMKCCLACCMTEQLRRNRQLRLCDSVLIGAVNEPPKIPL
jgi:hypothetical protein